MKPLRHAMIMASAGSGKTYALTSRFVELLAGGAPPERIVALTFTRKAAGEFFDEILHKLARAATDAAAARKLAAEIEQPYLQPADFLGLLRHVVDAMPRLRLGTLDSFFARIARAFPLELGLAGEFEVLQEHAARLERQRVLLRLFARSGSGPDAAQAEFIEAFKRATFGTEEKRLGARLDAFLDEHQEKFLSAPQPMMWGEPRRIWPEGSRWLDSDVKLAEVARELRAQLGGLTDGQRLRWENFFAALEQWTPGAVMPPPVEYILKNTLVVWDELCEGCAEIVVDRRKLLLPREACRALEQIITHLIGAELKRRIETTRGIYAVLRSYESRYHDAVRRAGRLTFADVLRLLQPDNGAPVLTALLRPRRGAAAKRAAEHPRHGGGGEEDQLTLSFGDGTRGNAASEFGGGETGAGDPALHDVEAAAERRLLIEYRLDAEIDHWLLDEFQDTSFGQWSVLRNLIDEVVQDPERRRSFFCVGDVKQAIYAWREGDPRLFREIFEHYNAIAPGTIEERQLTASYRSGPALIEMVNAVFGSAITLNELFPGAATATWNREWRTHRSAVPERTGHAALLHAEDEAGRWEVTRALLEEIRPAARGLSCAVLVKKNDTAAALADHLRAAGIAALAEADLHVAVDNPLGAALLALTKAAAHPSDTLSLHHLRMTPLWSVLASSGADNPEAVVRLVLEQIHSDGFERTLETWIERLEPHLAPDDAFSRQRARQFVAAAGLFDATGSRDIDEFIAFMERHTLRAAENPGAVRVMTVHKSKGLGFDVVILPDLQGSRIDEPREGLAMYKASDRSVQWVLDLPPRLFCEQDEVLSAFIRAAEADACYENLSLLYVAMTRAKRAMYVVTEPVGKSKSRNFPRLLGDTLGHEARELTVGDAVFHGPWSAGDSRWHVALAPAPALERDGSEPALRPLAAGKPHVPRLAARRASAQRDRTVPAGALFALETGIATARGTELHRLLAMVEWGGSADASDWQARWRGIASDAGIADVAASCLAAPALAHVWQRPAGGRVEVWRERAFEVVLDDAWITGVFDRVIRARDAAGAAQEAVVFDFKSDRVVSDADIPALVAHYRDQLNVYRKVAAVLTTLPPDRVRAELVVTARARAVPVV